MNETPIISKIVHQRCIRESVTANGFVSTVESYGYDQDGKLWRFCTDFIFNRETGYTAMSTNYAYSRAAELPEMKEGE